MVKILNECTWCVQEKVKMHCSVFLWISQVMIHQSWCAAVEWSRIYKKWFLNIFKNLVWTLVIVRTGGILRPICEALPDFLQQLWLAEELRPNSWWWWRRCNNCTDHLPHNFILITHIFLVELDFHRSVRKSVQSVLGRRCLMRSVSSKLCEFIQHDMNAVKPWILGCSVIHCSASKYNFKK